LIFYAVCLTTSPVFAQIKTDIFFETNQTSAKVGEEFFLDVYISPQITAINGISFSALLPENISFVRYQDATGLDGLWVDSPNIKNNILFFSRIFLVHYTGVIDPFNGEILMPARIVRLVVKGLQPGTGFVQVKKAIANKADGSGTEFVLTGKSKMITITDAYSSKKMVNSDTIKPILDAKLIPKNKYSPYMLLVADAKDFETGIKTILYKIDNGVWNEFTSPQVITKTCFDSITVKAIDWNGNETVSDKLINQDKRCDSKNWPLIGFILLLVLVMVVYVAGRERKKKY
jgi:hypothetical protein